MNELYDESETELSVPVSLMRRPLSYAGKQLLPLLEP